MPHISTRHPAVHSGARIGKICRLLSGCFRYLLCRLSGVLLVMPVAVVKAAAAVQNSLYMRFFIVFFIIILQSKKWVLIIQRLQKYTQGLEVFFKLENNWFRSEE